MTQAIGIDLGTTNSVIARITEAGRPEVLTNVEGNSITPSVIYFGGETPLVGAEAKEMQGLGEEEIASFFKRSMGDPRFLMEWAGRTWTAVDLSALVIQKLKADAEATLQAPITDAVITVPAYFNNSERQATIEAGKQAGLNVLQIINEPTAAALAFKMDETGQTETVLVYDLGGGTFDVSLVQISPDEIEVLATAGDHNLGGKDWDDRIATYAGERFADAHGVNPLDDLMTMNDILIKAEDAKKTLSVRTTTRIAIHHEGRSERIDVTRTTFEELTRDLMERTQLLCEQVLEEKGMAWDALTGVLLVGGSTRMHMVHEYVTRLSATKPLTGVNVDEAVALGAAVKAGKILEERTLESESRFFLSCSRRTRDVMSHSLGMIAEANDQSRYLNSIILPKNQPIPCEQTRPYQLRTKMGSTAELEVYLTQGESEAPLDCAILGKYRFSDIPPASSGLTVLDITYCYDENGVVQVSAKVQDSNQPLPMTVEPVPQDMSWVLQPPQQQVEHQPVVAYLAFDLSGSMSGAPLREAQEAAREFVRQTDLTHNSIGLVSFADRVHTDNPVSQNAKSLNKAVDQMKIGVVGYGNGASPFAHIHRLIGDVEGRRFIVLLTDGVWCCIDQAIQEAQSCHQDDIQVIAIGFGSADEDFLRKLATSEKASFFAQQGELVSTFGTIAKELTDTGGLRVSKSELRFF